LSNYQDLEFTESASLWQRWLPVLGGLFIIWFSWPFSGVLFRVLAKPSEIDALSLLVAIPLTLATWGQLLGALPRAIRNHHRFCLSRSGRLEVHWGLGFRSGSFELQADELQLIRCLNRGLQFFSIAKPTLTVPFSWTPSPLHERLCSLLNVPGEGAAAPKIPAQFRLVPHPSGEGIFLRQTHASRFGCLFVLFFTTVVYVGLVMAFTKVFAEASGQTSVIVAIASLIPWFWILSKAKTGPGSWHVRRGRISIAGLGEFAQGPVKIVVERDSEGDRTWAIHLGSERVWGGSKEVADDFAEWIRHETGWE
jgi:hypothetical protein